MPTLASISICCGGLRQRAILALSLRDEMLGRSVNLVNEKTVSLSLLWESLLSWGQASGSLAESAF